MQRAKFWMVLGKGATVHRHWSLEAAKTEAERLARLHPSCEFVVLESVATAVKTDVIWVANDVVGSGEAPPF